MGFFIFLLSDYVQAAFTILQEHPEVVPDRVGVLGSSAGSIVTLYLTAESTAVQVRTDNKMKPFLLVYLRHYSQKKNIRTCCLTSMCANRK